MAAPRAVAQRLRRAAADVAQIPDRVVAAVERDAAGVDAGSFDGRRLTVRTSRTSTGVTVVPAGAGAGAWSIRSYGRRGGYVVRGRRSRRNVVDLRRARTVSTAAATARPGPAAGNDAWRRRVIVPVSDTARDTLRRAGTEALS